jgi:hypothetical protein
MIGLWMTMVLGPIFAFYSDLAGTLALKCLDNEGNWFFLGKEEVD